MTAPGQEPDEVMTAKPGGSRDDADTADLDAVGDNHMPEDLRRSERAQAAEDSDGEASDADVPPDRTGD